VSLSTVLFLFLAHLGVGIVVTLLFVSREAGVKFFRFNVGLAAILLVVALAFYLQSIGPAAASVSGTLSDTGPSRVSAAPYQLPFLLCIGLTVFAWATIGRAFTKFRTAILAAAALAGVTTVVMQALAFSSQASSPVAALTGLSFLTSALLLGGACTAMILGHWYLVIPSMEVSHLQSIVRVHIASTAARVIVVAAAIWLAIATFRPDVDPGPSFRHYIFSIDGIFFWQRVLFGLAGPAVLSYLTWETAKIRSTQSATGILYVDFFTVVVGEVLAKYILLATRVPV
jgi:protein NrfD